MIQHVKGEAQHLSEEEGGCRSEAWRLLQKYYTNKSILDVCSVQMVGGDYALSIAIPFIYSPVDNQASE